jgi:UDP-N-acetylmuramoyl-L-alanyl-D-glutamate--2,6-diaminopimelate ligase
MEAYLAAKLRLTEYLAEGAPLVVNADVAAWAPLITRSGVVRYGLLSPQAEVRASEISVGGFGSRWELHAGGESAAVHLPLLGDFNVQNAVAAAAAAWALGMPLGNIAARLADVPQVPGRLERLADEPLVLRDYAHTPDALGRLLDAARGLTRGRLIVVFGCGGDRDRGKRPMMGAVASQKADLAIVTSDNPRTEDPERIIDEIVAGMGAAPYERIEDRRAAIARALDRARPGDVVVLAGKGHETYQIRGTTRYPFDEREVVAELLGAR